MIGEGYSKAQDRCIVDNQLSQLYGCSDLHALLPGHYYKNLSVFPFYCQVYENGPASSTETAASSSASSKSNYPCKKCGVVFSGYYELVKHQKRVCMKNNVVPLPFGNQVNYITFYIDIRTNKIE